MRILRKVDLELANQMNNQMFMGLEQDSQLSSDKVLSMMKNKALQKKYLGYYLWGSKPTIQRIYILPLNLIICITPFTVTGMAVNPEQTRVIYSSIQQ